MKLLEFRKKEYFLQINRTEALGIIESLANQMRENNPNGNRPEFLGIEGAKYFSISITEPGPEVGLREELNVLREQYLKRSFQYTTTTKKYFKHKRARVIKK